MARQLILTGHVQGVFCRNYCSQYASMLGIKGSASNLGDGSVRVIIDTDDESLLRQYTSALLQNPSNIRFYGKITDISVKPYSGTVGGDYNF